MGTMTPDEILKLDDQLLEAINSHDFDNILKLTSDDFQWRDWYRPEPLTEDEMRTYFDAWIIAFPDFEDERIERIVGEDCVTVEVVWSGTHSGPMSLIPGFDIPPTNKRITTGRGTERIRMRDGKITEWRTRPDVAGVLVEYDMLS